MQDVWLRYLRSLVTYLFVWQPPQAYSAHRLARILRHGAHDPLTLQP